MVVHGDEFIIAGDGDDLDWSSQKLNEKLELVQKARLGPGYDSEATVLNRCVTYIDSGLTWEADPRHAELAVAELGLQAARPQTSPSGAKPSAPLDHEELEARKECSRAAGKATRADLTRLKRAIPALHATCRVGVPAATTREHRADRWTFRCCRSWLPEDGVLHIWRMLARWSKHFGNLVVDTKSGVTEQRSQNTTAWYAVQTRPS